AGYTLTELADLMSAPKSSLFSIVHTLCGRRFLSQNPNSGRYTIGFESFVVGSAFLDSQTPYEHIKKEMTAVVNGCGEICQMGILDKGQVLYVAKVDSSESVRLISHIGKRLPPNCSALGKALLMNESPAALRALLACPGSMQRLTPHSITDVDFLLGQLDTFRASGIAEEYRESDDGIQCYAVPLMANGRTVAALSVSVPIFRMTADKTEQIQTSLVKARGNIESLLQETNMELDFFSFVGAR
ncbi:MAG: IclR family transcriptional regulator, partial [Pseudoflavonifractor sp.]